MNAAINHNLLLLVLLIFGKLSVRLIQEPLSLICEHAKIYNKIMKNGQISAIKCRAFSNDILDFIYSIRIAL